MKRFTMSRRCFGLVALSAVALAFARPAVAVDYAWNVANGDFGTAGNWSPAGDPNTASDRAFVDNGGTSNYTSGVRTVNEVWVGSQPGTTGTFAMTGGELSAVRFYFGDLGTATATVNNATLHAVTGEEDIFVGGSAGTNPGVGTLTVSGSSSFVRAGDDFILGRTGTGTLNVTGGRVQGSFTVVGKFGTGVWNHSGGVFDQNPGADIEIGDGGTPAQAFPDDARTGNINLTGGVIHGTGHFALGNRVGGGVVNVSGGALDITGDALGTGTIFIGRGTDWQGQPGAGDAVTLRVTGDDAVIAANGSLIMKQFDVASSATLVANITGPTHSPINIGGDVDISRGIFKVELGAYTPVSGDSWTIIEAGADLTEEFAAIDALVAAAGQPAVAHVAGSDMDPTLTGPFASVDLSMAPLSPGLSWSVNYDNNKVTLSVTGGPSFSADFNGDGRVDGADLSDWKNDFGPGNGSDADGDGDSDGNDFLMWQRQVGSGVPATPSVGAVPEPAGAVLLALGAAAFCAATRRR